MDEIIHETVGLSGDHGEGFLSFLNQSNDGALCNINTVAILWNDELSGDNHGDLCNMNTQFHISFLRAHGW